MPLTHRIIGIGEALFDVFPDETRLGGAPLNVAVHAHQLGNAGVVVSRIGQDELGEEVLVRLAELGMPADHIQTDPDRPTGTVLVDFDERGEPTYEIVRDVAWDKIQYDFDLTDLAQTARAVCFGSLAQRDAQSRNTIYRFLDTARRAVRLFDVNLRGDYYDRRTLERSLERSTAVKLNTGELQRLNDMLRLGGDPEDAPRALLRRFKVQWVALTRGEQGVVVYSGEERHEGPTVAASPGGDAVGAGDAASAALLHGVVRRWPWERTVELANRLGAHVASQKGACPPIPDALRQLAGA